MNDLLEELNEEQQKAVKIVKGPILILAGAGSGKTRVITHRIAHLLKKKIAAPREILAITFTNKAADEMRTRIYKLLDNPYEMWIRTFHSSCARIIREILIHKPSAQDIIRVTSNFTIYDEQDQIGLLKECFKDLNMDPREFSPVAVVAYINRVKQDLRDVEEVDSDLMKDLYKHYVGAKYDVSEARKRALKKMPNSRCLHCHDDLQGRPGSAAARTAHAEVLNPPSSTRPRCVDCHESAGHERENPLFPQ